MDHLWLLTEERPKPSVVLQIIKMYCKDFDDRITLHNEIKSMPCLSRSSNKANNSRSSLRVQSLYSFAMQSRINSDFDKFIASTQYASIFLV